MDHFHSEVLSKSSATQEASSGVRNVVSHLLLGNYYFLLILFHIPGITASLSQGTWLKGTIIILSVIAFIYCLNRLLRNQRLEDTWCMKMPVWVPAWVHRWMKHKSMMYMMMAMDIMLAWMSVSLLMKIWI